MHSIAYIYAEDALRLANERLDGFRSDADSSRLAAAQPSRSRFVGIRTALASLRSALTAVEPAGPSLPSLNDYPYRT